MELKQAKTDENQFKRLFDTILNSQAFFQQSQTNAQNIKEPADEDLDMISLPDTLSMASQQSSQPVQETYQPLLEGTAELYVKTLSGKTIT